VRPDEREPLDPRTAIGVEAPGVDEVVVLPWPLLLRRRVERRVQRTDRYPWIVLGAALVGLFAVGFSITVLTIALVNIAAEFDTSESVLIWIVSGPVLLGAVVTPAAGKLADLYGARRVYLLSMSCVTVFAALAALSWSAPSLILFRILGASIGAATGPASIAMINRLFPRERRAQALGYWALVAAGGPVVGVVIGGPVVEHVSWRWVFVAQVPLCLATVVVCALVFPDTPRDRTARFDVVGAVLLALGAGSFVVALNRAPEPGWGWTQPVVVGLFLAAPVFIGLFVWHERRVPTYQLLPLHYLRRRNVALPMANLFCANFAYMGGFFLTPLLLEHILGYSESKTGFLSIARPLAFSIAGPVAGWMATRVGERVNGVAGGLFLMASMLTFASITTGSTELVVIGALVLSGIGMGATAPAMSTAIANTVANHDLGVAGGAEQMFAQLGVVMGLQVMLTVQNSATDPSDSSAYAHAYLVAAVVGVGAVVLAAFMRPTVSRALRRGDPDETTPEIATLVPAER
jgi:EmrB/QacA subfamily drug resistance transporter